MINRSLGAMDRISMPGLMVSMAQNRSLDEVLQAVVRGMARCPKVALARIWLIEPGDQCHRCTFQSECPDQSQCLHLLASDGRSVDKHSDLSRLNGAFRRFPMNVRKIGKVAMSGKPLLIQSVTGDESWVVDREWIRREGIRTFAAQPLIFRDQVLGVLGLFDRKVLEAQDIEWLRIFADHAAVSIANARAFEEIEYLQARLEEENHYLREEVNSALGHGDIIGNSPALRKVLEQIHLVAPTDAAVLITGESGTGKELVARAIHENSTRSKRPLIKVNCSAITETLFESEFFGHVKGAFTGAHRDRPGRFELADGGTLFLDEIGEISLPMQTKLLRVLQEQEVERVGETRTRRVNVRIIAATNRDLHAEVDHGRFRQDLFYRLSVFPVDLPPLRERTEDIPLLAHHFIRQAAKRLNRPLPRTSTALLNRLQRHPWPGNIRELQNAMERAVILSGSGPLRIELPDVPGKTLPPSPSAAAGPIMTRKEFRDQERENILAALRETHGRVFGPRGAASLLGMKPTTLASRIKALGIRKSSE